MTRTGIHQSRAAVTAAVAFTTALFALSGVRPALAAEVCVVCSEPAAEYRCDFTGGGADRTADAGSQLACIREIASRGHHASCTVDRSRASQPCQGELVRLAAPSPLPAATQSAAAPDPAGSAPPVAPAEPASKPPPATVEELAKETAEQTKKDLANAGAAVAETTKATGETLKSVGDGIGNALKKSWDCAASIFSRC